MCSHPKVDVLDLPLPVVQRVAELVLSGEYSRTAAARLARQELGIQLGHLLLSERISRHPAYQSAVAGTPFGYTSDTRDFPQEAYRLAAELLPTAPNTRELVAQVKRALPDLPYSLTLIERELRREGYAVREVLKPFVPGYQLPEGVRASWDALLARAPRLYLPAFQLSEEAHRLWRLHTAPGEVPFCQWERLLKQGAPRQAVQARREATRQRQAEGWEYSVMVSRAECLRRGYFVPDKGFDPNRSLARYGQAPTKQTAKE